MMRLRCKMLQKRSEKGNPIINISVGGTPKTKEAYFCHIFIVSTIVQIVSCMLTAFKQYLNMEEMQTLYEDLLNDSKNMIIDMLVKPLKDVESVKKIEDTFMSLMENLKNAFNETT